MINVYLNYPTSSVTIHRNPNCGSIHRHYKGNVTRREEDISVKTLSSILQKFETEEIRFTSKAGFNGLWLKIDLADVPSEIAIVDHIVNVLGRSHVPFRRVVPKSHC